MMELEICVDSVESAIAAELGGAQRVELCSALSEGGLTPSAGMIRAARARVAIGLYVMIRPRGGDFLYSPDELALMRDDILFAKEAGADGVVLGLLTAAGDVDVERTRELVALAKTGPRPMEVTFHRAIDMTRDLDAAFEAVAQTGAARILTSGAAPSAMLGSKQIAALVRTASATAAPVKLMVCGKVRAANVGQIAQATGATEFHAALRTTVASPMTHRVRSLHLGAAGSDEYARHVVLARDVRKLRQAMDKLGAGISAAAEMHQTAATSV